MAHLACEDRTIEPNVYLAPELTDYVRDVSENAGIPEDEVAQGVLWGRAIAVSGACPARTSRMCFWCTEPEHPKNRIRTPNRSPLA